MAPSTVHAVLVRARVNKLWHSDRRTGEPIRRYEHPYVLRRATAWFAARGVRVERVLSDNGACYRSFTWRDTCTELDIKHTRTRPYRPQTNGKIERFHRTLADGWAYSRLYGSESARRNVLPAWIHHNNHHRLHTAIGKVPPIIRLTNVPGQYT